MLFKKLMIVSFALAAIAPSVRAAEEGEAPRRLPAPAGENAPSRSIAIGETTATATRPELPSPNESRPVPAESMRVHKSIGDSELKKYISGFRVVKVKDGDQNRLRFRGMVDPKCADHLRLELDLISATDEDEIQDAAKRLDPAAYLRVEKADLVDKKDRTKILVKADDVCSEERTKRCTRDESSPDFCIDVNKVPGVAGASETVLDRSGNVLYRFDDLKATEGENMKFTAIPKMHGGPIQVETAESLAAKLKADKAAQKKEAILAACKDALKGDRNAIELLRNLLGERNSDDYSKLFEKLESRADDNDMKALELRVASAKEEALGDLIDESSGFCSEHPNLKERCIRHFLNIADTAKDLEKDNASDSFFNKKLRLAERAIKAALDLDPRRTELRNALSKAKLARYNWAASTGNDAFYNDNLRREAYNEYRSVVQRARKNRDPEITRTAKEWGQTFTERPVGVPYMTPQGPTIAGYQSGTALDESFVKMSIQEEYRKLKESMMFGSGSDPR